MVAWYPSLKNLHLLSVAITTLMLQTHSALLIRRWMAFAVALIAWLAVIRSATTKMPLLGFV